MKDLTKKLLLAIISLAFLPLGHSLTTQGEKNDLSCFKWKGNTIVGFKREIKQCANKTEVIIPKGIMVLEKTFRGSAITKITLEDGVTIEKGAFPQTHKLKEVVFSAGSTVQDYPFVNNMVTKVTFEDGVTVEEFTFSNIHNIKEVVFGKNTIIKEGAFYESDITKITLGDGTIIEKDALANIKNLTEVVFGQNITIKEGALANSSLSDEMITNMHKASGVFIEKNAFGELLK